MLKMQQTNFRPRAAGRPSRSDGTKENKRVAAVREVLIGQGQRVDRAQRESAAAALGILYPSELSTARNTKKHKQHACSICHETGHKKPNCPMNPERRDVTNKKQKTK